MTETADSSVALALDENGFLLEWEAWDRGIAQQLADSAKIGALGETHFKVMELLREYYGRHKVAPMVHLLAKMCELNYRELYDLFGSNPGRKACLLAGLPKPQGCV